MTEGPQRADEGAAPIVAWEAPAAPIATADVIGGATYADGPPPFTVGGLLSDSFARYGADPIRFFLLAAVSAILSYAGSALSTPVNGNPFGAPSPTAGIGGLLGIVGFVVSLVAGSTTLALAEGGPSMPFMRALRRGVERAGWLFLTGILLGVGFFIALLIAAVPLVFLAIQTPLVAALGFLVVFVVLGWVGVRLVLAFPATVVDNLNAIDALKVSWRATKAVGVWARIFLAAIVLGLLAAPAGLGAAFALFPAMFGGSPLLVVAAAIGIAVLTPLSSVLTFSAYRRLVPPIAPSWTEAPQPGPPQPDSPQPAPPVPPLVPSVESTLRPEPEIAASAAAVDVSAERPRPAFRPPGFGTAAKAILALVIALDVAGILVVPYVVGEWAAGRIALPRFPGFPGAPGSPFPGRAGSVAPGTVAFGTSGDRDSCSVENELIFIPESRPVVWMAALSPAATAGDEVHLRISRDGAQISETQQASGPYDCLGTEVPEPPLGPGFYMYEVVVNGQVSAEGTLIVS